MKKEEIPMVLITKKTPLLKILELDSTCEQDGKCCEYGGGFIIRDDIPRLAEYLGLTENQFKAKYVEPIVRLLFEDCRFYSLY